jgi:hypothetical protein
MENLEAGRQESDDKCWRIVENLQAGRQESEDKCWRIVLLLVYLYVMVSLKTDGGRWLVSSETALEWQAGNLGNCYGAYLFAIMEV